MNNPGSLGEHLQVALCHLDRGEFAHTDSASASHQGRPLPGCAECREYHRCRTALESAIAVLVAMLSPTPTAVARRRARVMSDGLDAID